MATKKLMLNKARRLNDATYPLVMQVIHLRQKRVIYSKIYLCEEEYDEQSGIVIACPVKYRTPKEIKALNRLIDEFRQNIGQIILQCDERGSPYTVGEIAQKYQTTCLGESFYSYWQGKIDDLYRLGRFGISAAQRYTMRSVIRFHQSEHLDFKTVTASFVKSYRAYLLCRRLSPNTIAYYMRNFKAMVNSAIQEGVMAAPTANIFEGIDTRPKKTVKRALTRDELRALVELNLENEPELELARDLFIFSFYTRGMAFVDVAFLKKANLSGDTIIYARHKTEQFLRIGINEPILRLIEKYKSVSQYIFPVVHSSKPQVAYQEYRKTLRLVNLWLKIVGKRAGIAIPLTTYVARHSWATQAKELGASISIISEGLGHTSETVTRIYLKDFDQSVLNRLNDQVVDL